MFTLPTIDTVGTGIRIMDLRKKAIFNVPIDDIIVIDNKTNMQIGAWKNVDSDKWVCARSPSLKVGRSPFKAEMLGSSPSLSVAIKKEKYI